MAKGRRAFNHLDGKNLILVSIVAGHRIIIGSAPDYRHDCSGQAALHEKSAISMAIDGNVRLSIAVIVVLDIEVGSGYAEYFDYRPARALAN